MLAAVKGVIRGNTVVIENDDIRLMMALRSL